MHKYITLFFLTALFLTACKSHEAVAGILDKPEMTRLLTDIVIVDGTLYNISPAPDSLYKYGTGRYQALFKRYHTDSAQFRRSFKYYTSQPVELQSVFDKVFQNLKDKTDSLNKIELKQNTPHALPKK